LSIEGTKTSAGEGARAGMERKTSIIDGNVS
jgi:hypothetical protein